MWCKRFFESEDGISLVFVTITLPVIVGLALLVIDGSRFYSLHNDLQKGADALAIAGAAELDSAPDAITRAKNAIDNLVVNRSNFSESGLSDITEADIEDCYLATIPDDDDTRINPDDCLDEAAEQEAAQFVEITVDPHTMATIFPASFIGGADSVQTAATAVAGFAGVVVCEMTPLFMCNPFEPQHPSEVASSGNFYGKGMRLVEGGGDGQWGPGNFGFLRPSEDHGYGAGELTQDIARASVPECISSRGLYFRTGGPTPSIEGVNVRFDIYEGGHVSRTDATMPPGPNFRKGYKYKNERNPNACNMDPADELTEYDRFRPLTMDTCLKTLSCTGTAGPRIGDGMWDYEGYLLANGFTVEDMAGFTDAEGNAYSNANPPSRFELYKYELLNNLDAEASLGGETAQNPHCASNVSTDPERRLIYGALVNCMEHEEELNGASGGPVPAVGFASFFVTEPVNPRTNNDIVVEIVDIDGQEGQGTMIEFAKDQVQLYR